MNNIKPWHIRYNEVIANKNNELSDQEEFCLWVIMNIKAHNHQFEDIFEEVLTASRCVPQSPVFDDETDVEYAMEGLKNKDIIAYNNSSIHSELLH